MECRPLPWKVLVADDEEDVHRVTRLALANAVVLGRHLELVHVYSGREAVEALAREPDIAVVLLDVVMETEHAGLEAAQAIRQRLRNPFVRIVLRTGQPGSAPEKEVVHKLDINGYAQKAELTEERLHSLLHTSLRLHRELKAMDRNRIGLERVITASAEILRIDALPMLQRRVLDHVAALLERGQDALPAVHGGFIAERTPLGLRIAAACGSFHACEGGRAEEALGSDAMKPVQEALRGRANLIDANTFIACVATRMGTEHVVYYSNERGLLPQDLRLAELFCTNAAAAIDNLSLTRDVLESQQRLIVLLSAGIEERSQELHNHVKRVSEYSRLMGRLVGLSVEEIDLLGIAAAMHDLGKIGIPDSILEKPGKLTAEERAIIETHVQRGLKIIEAQTGLVMKTAQLVIGGHHERWDGTGYPYRVAGNDIPLMARITSIADVFDALGTPRVYKKVWTPQEIADYFRRERGRQFDPALVDLFLAHFDEFLAIRDRLPAMV